VNRVVDLASSSLSVYKRPELIPFARRHATRAMPIDRYSARSRDRHHVGSESGVDLDHVVCNHHRATVLSEYRARVHRVVAGVAEVAVHLAIPVECHRHKCIRVVDPSEVDQHQRCCKSISDRETAMLVTPIRIPHFNE
jgi:hypothetical protein